MGFYGTDYPSLCWLVLLLLIIGTSGSVICHIWRIQFSFVQEIIKITLTGVINLILWVLLILLILPITPLLLTVIVSCKIEEFILKKMYKYERLNSDAITWMFDSPKNPSIINGVFITENKFSIENLLELAQKRWVDLKDMDGQIKYPNLVKYLHTGFLNYYWRPEENFELKHHVFEWSQSVYSKNDFENLINELSIRPFLRDTNSAPWEMILIHMKENDETKSCLYVRVHHALADGTSIVHCIINHMSDEPAVTIPVPKISTFLKAFMKIKGCFHIPLSQVKTFCTKIPTHHLHCVNTIGKKNVGWSKPISLPFIKAIKDKLHVTINDVLVGCVATTFHRYFKGNLRSIPNDIVASLPFDTRFSIKEAEKFNNKFAVVPFPIPTDNDNTLQNIKTVRTRMNILKSSAENISARTSMRILNYCFPLWITKRIHSQFARRSSMIFSNVPGPRLPLKFNGTSVKQMSFWPPAKDDIGMSLAIISYNGKIWITIYCDNALNATSKDLLKEFQEVIDNLAGEVGLDDNFQAYEQI